MKTILFAGILFLNLFQSDSQTLKVCFFQNGVTYWDLSPQNSMQNPRFGLVFFSDSTCAEYEYLSNCKRIFRVYGNDIKSNDTLKWKKSNEDLTISIKYRFKLIHYSNDSVTMHQISENQVVRKVIYIKSKDQRNNIGKYNCTPTEY